MYVLWGLSATWATAASWAVSLTKEVVISKSSQGKFVSPVTSESPRVCEVLALWRPVLGDQCREQWNTARLSLPRLSEMSWGSWPASKTSWVYQPLLSELYSLWRSSSTEDGSCVILFWCQLPYSAHLYVCTYWSVAVDWLVFVWGSVANRSPQENIPVERWSPL